METAEFDYVNGYYWPYNSVAARMGIILSKRRFTAQDVFTVRMKGYRTVLKDGTEIGKLNVKA